MKEEIKNPFVHAYGYGTDIYERVQEGITLRDELAKTAMLGLLSNFGLTHKPDYVAKTSYEMADAMLKQRLS